MRDLCQHIKKGTGTVFGYLLQNGAVLNVRHKMLFGASIDKSCDDKKSLLTLVNRHTLRG